MLSFASRAVRSCLVMLCLIAVGCGAETTTGPIPAPADDSLTPESGSNVEAAIDLPPPPEAPSSTELPLEISVRDAEPLLGAEGVVWIDCREQSEWDAGHIAGVQLFPKSSIADRVDELEGVKNQRVIVYCRRGGRSLAVTKLLRANGFSKAQSMAGGITAWSEEIDPTLAPE